MDFLLYPVIQFSAANVITFRDICNRAEHRAGSATGSFSTGAAKLCPGKMIPCGYGQNVNCSDIFVIKE